MSTEIATRPQITFRYEDPLDLVWLSAARRMGIQVARDPHVFASWDGRGTLRIGVPETLDPDDCLAQMILHEVCHALVEGPDALQKPDWGLQIGNANQRYREHACLRLQAALTKPWGLRTFLAATTSFRTYYDKLPDDPLAACEDPAVEPAQAGYERASNGPWSDILRRALRATAVIASAIRPFASPDSLWASTEPSS